jgi:shikimate kinase
VAPIVVLVGAPGSGKTTIGKLLAQELSVEFIDTDDEIEKASQKTISQIFMDQGEAEFRKLEKAQVAKSLEDHPGVVSLGGGAVLNSETRELLKKHQTLWLQVGAKDAATRVGLAQARPVLVGNVRAKLVELLNQRTPLYEEVASFSIDTTDKTTNQVVQAALDWLKK